MQLKPRYAGLCVETCRASQTTLFFFTSLKVCRRGSQCRAHFERHRPTPSCMAEAREEGRWAHLLQPIRELSANWDVDLASDLGDYLAELERIEFSFDGGHTSLNFAEGAPACHPCRTAHASSRDRCAARAANRPAPWRIYKHGISLANGAAALRGRSGDADPGLGLRILAQSGAPAQAGVPGTRSGRHQEVRPS